MDIMRDIYKTTKAADHDTQLFWLRVNIGEQRGNCQTTKCSNYLVPGKDSYRVAAKDAEMKATGFFSVLLQYLTQQEPGQWSVPNSYDRL